MQSPLTKRMLLAVLLAAGALTALVGCRDDGSDDDASSAEAEGETSDEARTTIPTHLPLGVPKDDDSSDDLRLEKSGFVVSYNAERGGPNWVGWRLVAGDLGGITRQETFRSDTSLPRGVLRVNDADYENER